MKKRTLLGCLAIYSAVSFGVPHLEMEMTAQQYAAYFEAHPELNQLTKSSALNPVMEMGKRFLEWLNYINANSGGGTLSLSSAATAVGYPIDSPRLSNPSRILASFDELKSSLPASYQNILFKGAAFTGNPNPGGGEFIHWGLAIVSNYQSASRWILQEPFLISYSGRRKMDLRGYYFLEKESDLLEKLKNWAGLPLEDKTRLSSWLMGQCFNSNSSESSCRLELQSSNNILSYYQKYRGPAKSLWDSLFTISNPRHDIEWTSSHADELRIPFRTPSILKIQKFLVDNIEEEWKWDQWQLRLQFKNNAASNVAFEAGATPHVEGVGGNTITMDANAPLAEYDVQWTIRHEFGHILGFPDCYLEFFDDRSQTMVSYQLDISNLMCSRRGHLKQTHYDQLRKNYYH